MRILILGGMHGDEPLGPKLINSLKKRPIKDIDVLIANPKALKLGQRFVNQDLNRSFPGDSRSLIYEERRAASIIKICKNYDLVLDFHNTLAPNNDCIFIGESAGPNLPLVGAWLGLKRVVVAPYDCINKYATNCLSVEISTTSNLMQVNFWRKNLRKLSQLTILPRPKQLEFYRYTYTISKDQWSSFGLRSAKKLEPFLTIPPKLARSLSLDLKSAMIFIGKNYSKNVYAGVVEPLEYKIKAETLQE